MAEMTSRERLLTAIRHQEPDQVPVSPRISAWLLDYYGDASFETHLRCAQEFGWDLFYCHPGLMPNYVVDMPEQYLLPDVSVEQTRRREGDFVIVERTFHTPAGPLSDCTRIPPARREYGIDPNPVKLEYLVKSPEDLERLPYLLPEPVRNYDAYLAREKTLGDRGLCELYVNGALDCRAGDARSMADLMTDALEAPEFFRRLLRIFHEHVLQITRAALEAGVRIIFGTWFYASMSAGWSPVLWREFFFPLICEHIDLVHSYGALYHYYDDGKCMAILPWLREAGVDVLSTCTPPPVGDFDLAQAKAQVGDRICLKGYVDLLYVVKLGTPELVERTVREALEIAKPGGGFILGSSDSFRDGTPLENIRAYFEAARRYGGY
jgi:uroporphyrinogen decarboxylase